MEIQPFATEEFFARYEFSVRHLLAASDCETVTAAELLALAGMPAEALLSERLGYTESTGRAALREEIAKPLARLGSEHVLVVNAPQEGIYLSMHALLEPGDDVVVMTPCYDSLRNVAAHIGATVHPWTLHPVADGWRADLDELRALLHTHAPQLVVINVPHNPTGYLPTPETFRQLLDLCADAGARVFCDEMYRGLELDGAEQLPVAADISPSAITLSGLSKAFGLPGLRAGWLIAEDDELRRRILGWKNYTTICPATPVEVLAIAGVRAAETLAARNRSRVAANASLAREFFGDREGFVWRAPRAGSIALLETPWSDALPVCHQLADEHGVLLLPGACLGAPPEFVRVGLGREGFSDGLSALAEGLRTRATGDS